MPIPKHHEIWRPALTLLMEKNKMKPRDFIDPLASLFKLSDEEVAEIYPSGKAPIFYDRISWALSYLNLAGLVKKPKRGIYQINEKGIELLNTPEKINQYIEETLKKRDAKKSKKQTTEEKLKLTNEDSNSELTPQEKLYHSFQNIRKSIFTEILETILSKTPPEFEKLVVLLLQKMGYGGEIKNAGQVTKYSNDGGIDGIIKEDILGLGRIHIQAKRYALDNSVGRESIQKFVGALAVAQSNKGVFITTSYFSKGAIEYAESLNGSTNVVLIDGKKLAEYIYDFGLGMQVEQTIKIKKLDADFWDSMKDEN